MTGVIYKATAGYYYVYADGDHVTCRARGLMRKDGRSPLVGDIAEFEPEGDGTGTITGFAPRKNQLIRPALANLDFMLIVLSVTDPLPNLPVADKLIAVLEHKDIEPVIVLTKTDLAASADSIALADIYRQAGFTVFVVDSMTGTGVDALRDFISGHFCALCGNSGVGKSSLINALAPGSGLTTGETSKKLGRGRHTTRTVEVYGICGGFVADTPGFSTVEVARMSEIDKGMLAACFRDFTPYQGKCRFQDCAHLREAGCAVTAAVEAGEIPRSRHESYAIIYNEIKDLKHWQR